MRSLPTTDDVLAGKNPSWDYHTTPVADPVQTSRDHFTAPPVTDETPIPMPSEAIANGTASTEEVKSYLDDSAAFMDQLDPTSAAYSFTTALCYSLKQLTEGLTKASPQADKDRFNAAYDNTLTWVDANLNEEFQITFLKVTLALFRLPVNGNSEVFQTLAAKHKEALLGG